MNKENVQGKAIPIISILMILIAFVLIISLEGQTSSEGPADPIITQEQAAQVYQYAPEILTEPDPEPSLVDALEDFSFQDPESILQLQAVSAATVEGQFLDKQDEIVASILQAGLNPEDLGYAFLPSQPAQHTHTAPSASQLDIPLILQTDPRWSLSQYGFNSEDSMKKTGCAIATLAMVEAAYGDPTTTPEDILDWSGADFFVENEGTSWKIFEHFARDYHFQFTNYGGRFHDAMQALDQDQVVITSVVPGYFTEVGHIMVIRGYDPVNRLVYVNDPNDDPSKMFSVRGIPEGVLIQEGINYWAFSK